MIGSGVVLLQRFAGDVEAPVPMPYTTMGSTAVRGAHTKLKGISQLGRRRGGGTKVDCLKGREVHVLGC